MNKDVFEGKWKEMRGQAKQWWGKLTDDDLKRAGGKYDQLIGLLQQKYGYTRQHAEEEFDQRFATLVDSIHKPGDKGVEDPLKKSSVATP